MIPLDKTLYREAYQQYRQWNEMAALDRATHANQHSYLDLWQQYVELVEFCWQISPQQSEYQRLQKIEAVEQYHQHIRRLEIWRKKHGKTA